MNKNNEEGGEFDLAKVRDDIVQAVAQGWCAPECSDIEMDSRLATAICRNVQAIFARLPEQQQASTAQEQAASVPAGWRSMQSAPQDGTQILIRFPKQGNVKALVWFSALHKCWMRNGDAVFPESQGCEWVALPPDVPAPAHALTDAEREAARDALSAALGDAMDCTRVWSAWGVGTMGEDDFQLVADNDERIDEILDAVLDAAHLDRKG